MAEGPAPDCSLCPRLAAYRADNAAAQPDWFNGAVPAFGAMDARLLVVGLAPGVTGANRTGRPFTGDWAGDLLYGALSDHSFAEGIYDKRADDGFRLVGARVTNAVRCVPPQNKPVAAEINTCRPFLTEEITAMPDLKVILCLGRISHDSTLRALGLKPSHHAFGHGSEHIVEAAHRPVTLLSSYHCSRYNTNTGRLTEEMFHTVMARARALADAA
ncbi:MAG: uracil-DNA glycosylase [Hyphomonadaceae bacterium]|nr:uracil-DNA glycosylase [Hyphomonadaceae bacterium]